ncbi:MAG TPA: phage head closure protein [Caproicibacter sp.]|nr:phage head closure protein [Caproicibacter sp.]
MENEKIQAGDLRTQIRIQHKVTTGTGANKNSSWFDLDGTPASSPPKAYTHCYWYPLGGAETWAAQAQQVVDAANVIIRYNSAVTSQCRVIKDGVIYSIIAPNDPDQHRHWLKFKVKAAVNGG